MDFSSHKYIFDFLDHSAQRYPDKIALIYQKQRLTYKEINDQANALAHQLVAFGVKSGDRVLLLLENSIEYAIGYYGILKAGATVVPVNTDIKTDGLAFIIKDTDAKVFISSSMFQAVINNRNLKDLGIDRMIVCDLKSNVTNPCDNITLWTDIFRYDVSSGPDISIEENSLASIIYTSGSTGKPKGVMLSHQNIVSNTHAICQSLDLSYTDIQMVVLPFFYVMGMSLLNSHFAVCGTLIINNTFIYPATVLNQMVEEKVTGFSGVPSTYAFLLHRSPLSNFRDKLPHLRYCSQAGGHMARGMKLSLRQALPDHTKIFIMYGATEASARLTCLDAAFYESKMDSVGKPIPGTTIHVVDEQGRTQPANVVGELLAQGPGIMAGYWNNPQATALVLNAAGYRTGDLGYKDEDDFIFIIGREDNQLKVGGNRINTQEIEDLLMETEFVIEAFVTGYPDELLGQKLMAIIVGKNKQLDNRTILAKCTQLMPRYKIPHTLLLVPSLPKTASGKIDKNKCMMLLSNNIRSDDDRNIENVNNGKGCEYGQH